MSLTVEQALKDLPVFSPALLVAGAAGTNRVIRWTHIIDNPDVLPWVQEGHLLVTTAFALKENPASMDGLIPRLVEKHLAGMVISAGRYITDIPAAMIEDADELGFPIIRLPWEVPLVDVTYAIHERIISEQYSLNQQTYQIHNILTNLVLEGGGLEDLANSLADILQRSVTVEDIHSKVLSYATIEPTDEIRQRSISEGQTPPELVEYLTRQGIFDLLLHERRPIYIQANPELGLTLERIIAPIMVGSHVYGYIWVIATDTPLTEIDFLAIERAAMVAALILSRQQAIDEAEQRIRTSLLESLINPLPNSSVFQLTETMRRLGMHGGYHTLVVQIINGENPAIPQFHKLVIENFKTHGIHAIPFEWGDRNIILVGTSNSSLVHNTTSELLHEAMQQGFQIQIGLSSACNQATQMRQSYQEATDALYLGTKIGDIQEGIWSLESLGYLNYLLALPEELRDKNKFLKTIQLIAAYDSLHHTDYVTTLETYLESLCNGVKTAQLLFIHRNTLNQRLEKISENWSLDLDNPHIIYNLYIAIKDYRLSH